jgi:hypothetical protein
MTYRLPWQRNPEGGFIAYPEGEQFKDRFACIRHDMTSSVPWHWRISYDEAKRANHAMTKQAAADAATVAWPEMKAEAARLSQLAAEAEALRTMVQRMMLKGDLSLSLFAIESSDSDRLRRIIALARETGGLGGPGKPLVEACSAELFSRRRGSVP